MRDFFRGWRRTVGCVLLVMAILFAGSWVRSYMFHDGVSFSVFARKYTIHVRSGHVMWLSHDPMGRPGPYVWSDVISPEQDLEFGTLPAAFRPVHWEIPHGALVWPSLLFSAYLILWKPRQKTKPPVACPNQPATTQ